MDFKSGVAEFTLKDGESATALNLPPDIEYTVTETRANQDGFTTEATGDNSHLGLWIALMVIGVVGAAAALWPTQWQKGHGNKGWRIRK